MAKKVIKKRRMTVVPAVKRLIVYDQAGTPELGGAMPEWWLRPSAPGTGTKLCYRTKADAVKAFAERNSDVIEAYGGPSMEHTPAEFDSINQRYGLKGKARVKTMGKALWETLREGPPWCLENYDLATLNETSPAIHGKAFELPDAVLEVASQRKLERELEDQAIREGTVSDCFGRRRRLINGKFRKDGHPGFVPGSRPERACVCRKKNGQFTRCQPMEEVPF